MLPQRVVGILNRQPRTVSRPPLHPRRIKPRKIPPQNPQRPPVPSDVMQNQKQYVLLPRQRKQMPPQRRLHPKLEPTTRRRRQRRAQPILPHRPYHQPRPRRLSRQNLLPRNPQRLREHRAQALVPLNQVPKRSFQRPRIASTECPPSTKKLSSIPTRPTPKPPANRPHSISSCGGRGIRRAPVGVRSAAGSARRSSLPFGVSGRPSTTPIADGTM